MKKIAVAIMTLAFVGVIGFIPMKADAANTQKGSMQLNGTVSNYLGCEEGHIYSLNVTESGRLYFEIKANDIPWCRIQVFSVTDQNNAVYEFDQSCNYTTNVNEYTAHCDLRSGEYKVIFYDNWRASKSGGYSYSIITTFESANETYPEGNANDAHKNDRYQDADLITFDNKIYGQLSRMESQDWYKFTLDKPARINIRYDFDDNYKFKYHIHDANFLSENNWHDVRSRSGTSGVNEGDIVYYLTAGTYYFVLENWDYYYDRYSKYNFIMSVEYSKESFPESGKGSNNNLLNAQSIDLNTSYVACLNDYEWDDWFKFTVPNNCKALVDVSTDTNASTHFYLVSDAARNDTFFRHSIGKCETFSDYVELTAGTYYIHLYRDWDSCGDTTFKITTHVHDFSIAHIEKASPGYNGKITYECACHDYSEKYDVIPAPEKIVLSKSSFVYNKKVQKPKVTIKKNDKKALATSNYSVKFGSGCKKIGRYSINITFKGDYYEGSMNTTYDITPKGTTLSAVKKGSRIGSIRVSYKKQSSGTNGYQIQYSLKKNFKNYGTYTVYNKNTTKADISGLRRGKKYYVRIRTYANTSGGTVYSPWSKAKTVYAR